MKKYYFAGKLHAIQFLTSHFPSCVNSSRIPISLQALKKAAAATLIKLESEDDFATLVKIVLKQPDIDISTKLEVIKSIEDMKDSMKLKNLVSSLRQDYAHDGSNGADKDASQIYGAVDVLNTELK